MYMGGGGEVVVDKSIIVYINNKNIISCIRFQHTYFLWGWGGGGGGGGGDTLVPESNLHLEVDGP